MDEDDDELLARALEVLQKRAAARAARALTVLQLFALYEAAFRTSKSWPVRTRRLAPFLEAFGDRPALSIEVRDWSDHAARRLVTPIPDDKRGRCYGKRTINFELSWAKALYNWGVTEGQIRYNPLVSAKGMRGVPKGRKTAPKEWEIQLLLGACETPRQTVMVLSACDVGMRRGEIVGLRHDWIDHETKTVALPDHACKNGKGGTVPATQRFLDAVEAVPRHIRYPFVIWSDRGAKRNGAISKDALNSWWVAIRTRAGVACAPGDGAIHLHDGRAACASNAIERGVKLRTVSKRILRHASLSTTEIYLRGSAAHDPDETAAATAAFEAGIVRDLEKRKGPKRSNVDFAVDVPHEHSSTKTTT